MNAKILTDALREIVEDELPERMTPGELYATCRAYKDIAREALDTYGELEDDAADLRAVEDAMPPPGTPVDWTVADDPDADMPPERRDLTTPTLIIAIVLLVAFLLAGLFVTQQACEASPTAPPRACVD